MSELRSPGVVSVTEIWDGTGGGIDEFGNRRYVRAWRVLVDDLKVGPLEATATGQLPAQFSFYEFPNGEKDIGATLRDYDVQRQADGFTSIVRATYSSAPTQTPYGYNPFDYGGVGGTQTGNALEQDPLLRPPEIQWGSIRVQKQIQRDLDNKRTTASNGQRFDPPIMRDLTIKVLSISRNESLAAYNPIVKMAFENTTNSTTWIMTHPLLSVSIGAGLAKCETISAQSQSEQKKLFWRVNYVFHINPNKKKDDNDNLIFEGWDIEQLDVGTYYWDNSTGVMKRKNIIDRSNGQPVTSPVPLDGTGKELAPIDNNFPVTFNYKHLSFRVYEQKDFNTLVLP